MDEIIKLKADAYDINIELDVLRKRMIVLEEKKAEIGKKIEGSSNTPKKVVVDKDLKDKEAKIMQKRLAKIRGASKKEDSEEEEE